MHRLLLLLLLGLTATSANAQYTLAGFNLEKIHIRTQTDAGTVGSSRYEFDVNAGGGTFPSTYTVSVQLPAGGASYDKPPGAYAISFSNQAALDAAFPNGSYQIGAGADVSSLYSASLSLTGDKYPGLTPMLTSGTWDGSGHLLVNDTSAYTFNFNSSSFNGYTTGTGYGYVTFTLRDGLNNTIATATTSYPQSPTAMVSFTINSGLLQPGQSYSGLVEYGKAVDVLSGTPLQTEFGGNVIALYANQTQFAITAVPEPSTSALFAASLGLLALGFRRRFAVKP